MLIYGISLLAQASHYLMAFFTLLYFADAATAAAIDDALGTYAPRCLRHFRRRRCR